MNIKFKHLLLAMPSIVFGGALCGTLTALPTQEAQAQQGRPRGQIIICESVNNRQQYCRADTRDGVELHRQLSKSPCRENRSWGYDRRGIWVDDGCRAEFRLGGRGGGGNWRDDDDDRGRGGNWRDDDDDRGRGDRRRSQRITCSADGDGYRLCPANVRNDVIMIQQFSRAPCRIDRTWGFNRRGVWVDQGCRAEFEIR